MYKRYDCILFSIRSRQMIFPALLTYIFEMNFLLKEKLRSCEKGLY